MPNVIKYIDLFSGCGGLSYGFYKNKSFKGILATDIWKEAKNNYDLNHKGIEFRLIDFSKNEERDKIISEFKGRCDLVIGGPPCQGFSTLGKREVNCEKSVLVDAFLNAAIDIGPRFIIMENVKAIRSKKHPDGGTFSEKIDFIFKSSSYVYKTIILNSLDFGLGQTRQRFFLFACKKSEEDKLIIFLDLLNKYKNKNHTNLFELIGDLPSLKAGEEFHDVNGMIFNHKAMNHSDKLVERLTHVPKGGGLLDVPRKLLTNHLIKMVDGVYGNGGHAKNIYGRMDWDSPSGTIVAGMDKITIGRFVHPVDHRLLTPRECARIQSFPDEFIFNGSLVTQYYLIGNAVPPIFSEVLSKVYLEVFGG